MANGTGRQTPPNTAKHRQRTDEVLAVPLAPLGEPPLRRADGVPAGPIWSYHRIASTNQYPMTMGTTLSIVHHRRLQVKTRFWFILAREMVEMIMSSVTVPHEVEVLPRGVLTVGSVEKWESGREHREDGLVVAPRELRPGGGAELRDGARCGVGNDRPQ